MDIRGLLLANSEHMEERGQAESPLATLDVAGKSALQRMAERLQQYGISSVSAVVEGAAPVGVRNFGLPSDVSCVSVSTERFWRTAESVFNDMAQSGAELVVLIRLGAFVEADFEKLIQFHLDRKERVTQMASDTQKLEIFCISASRRNDAASLFRTQLAHCRSECPLLQHEGYLNSLANPRDLRQFAIDILIRQTQTCPTGKEIKPGVWTAAGAMIEKGARVLAPAFVGSMARIRSGAVITRCSSIERHAEIDCGTVVENSTVLPYSYVGAGLDLAHSVAGMGRIVNLHRDVSVTIVDTKLISSIPVASGKRLITSAAEVLTYLPRLAFQGIFAGTKAEQPDLQATLRQTSPALGNAAGFETSACDTEASHKFPNMVVARRYGHQ
ncbi:MAG: putative mannose-phosphate guanyltransferase [Candidatus Angelobacter sp.]|nr:putative mannose-phosphate guanyltransferase [Candidatus Angelobacter sp.]